MRIEALDLRAFGPFTGKRLDFATGTSDLHVVYGPNEAGKSSGLRALSAALFGIPGQTPDNFVHDYTALRVGMQLGAADGTRLSFLRRKGRTKTLWDASESTALSDDALARFLAGVDEEEFLRVFGLDHVRLREGSEQLLTTSEGADEAIVGAALGVSGLRGVTSTIDQDAAKLFTSRRSKAAIHASIALWKEAQKALRDDALSMSAWKDARRASESAATDRDKAEQQVEKLRHRERELDFVLRNRPRVARLERLRSQLADFHGVPDVAEDFADRYRAAADGVRSTRVLLDQARTAEQEANDRLAEMPGDFSFLDGAPEVERLREQSIVTTKGEQDRERRLAEARAAAAERDRIGQSLGLSTPLNAGEIDALRIGVGQQQSCQNLLQERAALESSRKDAEKRIGTLRRELGACADRIGAASALPDRAALDRAITSARRLGDPDAVRDELRRAIEETDAALVTGLNRLPEFAGTADELAARPVPGAETLREFRSRFDELESEERLAQREIDDARRKRDLAARAVEHLASEQAVPSEEDLQQLRARRNEQWRLVRRAWLDRENVEEAAHAIDPDHPLAESFERSLDRGDDLADRLRQDSQRVAELAGKRSEHAESEARLARLEAAARTREERRKAFEADWRAAWDGSGFAQIGTLAIMQDVLAERAKLLDLVSHRRDTVARHGDVCRQIKRAQAALTTALETAGVPRENAVPADEQLAPVLEHAEAYAEDLRARSDAHDRDEAEHLRLESALAAEGDEWKSLNGELEAWSERFATARSHLPWREGAQPETVTSTLAKVTSLLQHHDTESKLRERIASIDEDSRELAERVKAFRAAHAPGLPDGSAAETIARLGTLVEQGKREKQAFEGAAEDLARAEQRRKETEAQVEVAERTLADLAAEVEVASAGDLPETVRQATEKRKVREDKETLEQNLLDEGSTIDQTEARVAALDGQDVESELTPLRTEIEQATKDAAAKRDEATKAGVAFEELQRRVGAAERAAQAESIAAGLREDVERWARLVLAGRLLRTAIERFRERNEAPMLKHASRYFTGLTRGAYTKVETDLDDRDRPHFLVRESASAAAKRVGDLSDGTRDQLHLALVLGSLEHRFAAGAEPMPLVLDDVLVHFDDARSQAALETLAAFSKTTQVLLFTHHEKIREQAKAFGEIYSIGSSGR